MHDATTQFLAYLDKRNVRYTLMRDADTEPASDVVKVAFSGEQVDVTVTFFFDHDNEHASLRVFNLVKVPAGKISAMLTAVNQINNEYRFAKFCLDPDDNTIQAEMDCIFRQHDIDEICNEAMVRIVNICNEAYPVFMKSLWS
ncbi:MAG: YbjN domain-containing protein [Clostridia bacterium]|nr:YbjN domain-containing protein [Clostridia bacterium]